MNFATAEQTSEQQRADELTREQLYAYLVRLGGRYERATLAQPRDYSTMQTAEQLLVSLQAKHDEVNCGISFRRGQNFIRRLRGLEEVAAW